MKKYRVQTDKDSSAPLLTLDQAERVFERWKDDYSSDGVQADESFVEIVESDDDFEDYKVIKKVIAVIDHDRTELRTPREEGLIGTIGRNGKTYVKCRHANNTIGGVTMGEAKRRKLSGDYPATIEETPIELQTPGRKVVVVGSGNSFGMLAALLTSGKTENLEVNHQ
ncbi:MAG TPA: hypothetical protein VGI33_19625 [Paenibacillus sp.]|jgi:hypothetical protein